MRYYALFLKDLYSDAFLARVAAGLRGGLQMMALVRTMRAQKEAQRQLCLEDEDLWCCGSLIAAQSCCAYCGQATSEAVQNCPAPLLLTSYDQGDLMCLNTAAGLAWINQAMGGRNASSQSWPNANSYTHVVLS